MTSQAQRRQWFAAHLMDTWKRQVRPAISKGYSACDRMRGDTEGTLGEILLEQRAWFAAAVASIDDVLKPEEDA